MFCLFVALKVSIHLYGLKTLPLREYTSLWSAKEVIVIVTSPLALMHSYESKAMTTLATITATIRITANTRIQFSIRNAECFELDSTKLVGLIACYFVILNLWLKKNGCTYYPFVKLTRMGISSPLVLKWVLLNNKVNN